MGRFVGKIDVFIEGFKVLLRWKMLFSFSLDSDFIFGKNAPCQLLRLKLKNKSDFEYDVFLLVTQAYSDKVKKKSECSQQESNL